MAAAASRTYVVSWINSSVTTSITIIQLLTVTNYPAQILRAVCSSSTATSTQQLIQLRQFVAAHAGNTRTSFTPVLRGPATDPIAKSAGGTAATSIWKDGTSVEPTPDRNLRAEHFNYLNGWLYLPSPKEWDYVDPTSGIMLGFPSNPTGNFSADLIFEELA